MQYFYYSSNSGGIELFHKASVMKITLYEVEFALGTMRVFSSEPLV